MSEPTVSPVPLMQLSTGFWAFKTLAAAHELELFNRLSGSEGITSEEFSHELGVHQRLAEMLLTGCAALGLLEKREGRYHNSPLAEEFLGVTRTCGPPSMICRSSRRLLPERSKRQGSAIAFRR